MRFTARAITDAMETLERLSQENAQLKLENAALRRAGKQRLLRDLKADLFELSSDELPALLRKQV